MKDIEASHPRRHSVQELTFSQARHPDYGISDEIKALLPQISVMESAILLKPVKKAFADKEGKSVRSKRLPSGDSQDGTARVWFPGNRPFSICKNHQ